jgi:predicted short-subunit dehydrogenase-like oxidoreductase (DUF2520 family)
MNIIFIGAGNVATHLAKALHAKKQHIVQVVSRTTLSAQKLAESVGASWTTTPEEIEKADVYIYAVSDSALQEVIRRNPQKKGLHIHTAGSLPLSVFEGEMERGGVFYPLQTFSKQKPVDFAKIPLFIEANSATDRELLQNLADSLSKKVYAADSQQRQQLHLAAVFACNFTNHLFAVAEQLLNEAKLPFDVLRPLIEETVQKTTTMSPLDAQTGPAIRHDLNVMDKHIAALTAHLLWQDIYRLISESIQTRK